MLIDPQTPEERARVAETEAEAQHIEPTYGSDVALTVWLLLTPGLAALRWLGLPLSWWVVFAPIALFVGVTLVVVAHAVWVVRKDGGR